MRLIPFLFLSTALAQVSLRLLSKKLVTGKTSTLQFEISENKKKLCLLDLDVLHEQRIHALIIPKDLNSIAHVHPVDQSILSSNSTLLSIPAYFQEPGEYTLFISYSVRSIPYTLQQVIHVVSPASYTSKAPVKTISLESYFTPLQFTHPHSQLYNKFVSMISSEEVSYKARMTLPVTSSDTCYRFELLESMNGSSPSSSSSSSFKPIKNLTPYLGMSGHFTLINEDSTVITHLHGNSVACMEEATTPPTTVIVPNNEASGIKKRLKRSGIHMHEVSTSFGPFLYVTIDKSFKGFHRLVVQTARGNSLINLFYGLQL